jgi:RNA polymerase sigma-70 factor, ECF subfamily
MLSSAGITQLLIEWSEGDEDAKEKVFILVERELHRLAHHYIRQIQPGNSLQTTALINEAYIRLVDQTRVKWQNRAHFFAIAATIMRRILLSYIRDAKRRKRGSAAKHLPLEEAHYISDEKRREIVALELALRELEAVDERKAKIVELRYFGGLSLEETAAVLNISVPTAVRHWNLAKAWIAREIRGY